MDVTAITQPQRISFGPGAATACVDDLASRGLRRILLVTSPSVAPHARSVMEGLVGKGVVVATVANVAPRPTLQSLESVFAEARPFCPDGIVAFGGGGVLDIAKALAALLDRPEPVPRFFGGGLVPRRKTALAALPTTFGSGSECAARVTVYDEDSLREASISSPWLVPDALFVDPVFTLSLPVAATAAAGVAALGRCLEAFADRAAPSFVRPHAERALQLLGDHLEAALANSLDLRIRSQLALGGLHASLACQPAQAVTLQIFASPLARRLGISRSLACAAVAHPVLAAHLGHSAEAFAAAAAALRVQRQPSALSTATAVIEKLRALAVTTGVAAQLADCRPSDETVTAITEEIVSDPRLPAGAVRRFNRNAVRRIVRKAFEA